MASTDSEASLVGSDADSDAKQPVASTSKGVSKKSSKGKRKASSDDESEKPGSESDESPMADSDPTPKAKAKGKKRKSDGDQGAAGPTKRGRKAFNPVKTFAQSKEYIDSEGNPVSSPPPGVDVPPSPKPKKSRKQEGGEKKAKPAKAKAEKKESKKSSKAEEKLYGGTDEQEAEIRKLKELVNACGAKVAQKALADLSASEVLTRLTTQLTDLGMKRPFSHTKAKTIKTERELAKEVADIGGSRSRVDTNAARASRSAGASKPMWLPKPSASDDEEEEEVDERKEKVKDRRANSNVMAFLGVLKRSGEI